MDIRVQQEVFDLGKELSTLSSAQAGAVVSFLGTVREISAGLDILALEIEHYPGMTERELTRLAEVAMAHFALIDILIIHRYGRLMPEDPIVLVAVCSAHRADAFAACRYLIDTLKTTAPFWKREISALGARWVTDCPGCRAGIHDDPVHRVHMDTTS
jgi:molybdopterin synthase catalytic subunit